MCIPETCDRREFLSKTGQLAFGLVTGRLLTGCQSQDAIRSASSRAVPVMRQVSAPEGVDVCVARGKNIDAMLEAAVDGLGGVGRFVRKGDRVVLSPNIAFARTPETAATTHPHLIRAVVRLCQNAGAQEVTVLDYTLDNARAAFDINGASRAVAGTGATLISPAAESLYDDVPMAAESVHGKSGIRLKVAQQVLRADVFIPMPVVKDHEATGASLSMKKLMGCIWDRQAYHRANIHACIAELASILRPTFIVADATRVLQTHGPKGPGEVTHPDQIVVGTMPASVDAYCCTYLTLKKTSPQAVKHIQYAAEKGLGVADPATLKVKKVVV